MMIEGDFRDLGAVDHRPLKEAVAALAPEAWIEDNLRQTVAGNVHSHTQSIILLFCEGWPDVEVSRRRGWDMFAHLAEPLMDEIIARGYRTGGTLHRAMIAKLLSGGVINPHIDAHPSFAVSHRIHVPLITDEMADFFIDKSVYHFAEGIAFEVNNLKPHAVRNRSPKGRVHFIFDYVEP